MQWLAVISNNDNNKNTSSSSDYFRKSRMEIGRNANACVCVCISHLFAPSSQRLDETMRQIREN